MRNGIVSVPVMGPKDLGSTTGGRVPIRPLSGQAKGYWLLVRRSVTDPGDLAYYGWFLVSWDVAAGRNWCVWRVPGG